MESENAFYTVSVESIALVSFANTSSGLISVVSVPVKLFKVVNIDLIQFKRVCPHGLSSFATLVMTASSTVVASSVCRFASKILLPASSKLW